MIKLSDLVEIEQNMVMKRYVKDGTNIFRDEEVEIPDMLMGAYRCASCKKVKYVRIHKVDILNLAQTISCDCDRNTRMRLKYMGATNIMVKSVNVVSKKVFTLDDFFGDGK